jgi:lysozyme
MNTDLLKQLLILHEGLRSAPYHDSKGILTIGVGHNLKASPLPASMQASFDESGELTYDQCIELLNLDVELVIDDLVNFEWFAELSDIRKAAIADMRFNLGHGKFRGFHHMIAALGSGDYQEAAKQMLASDWASEVGTRAETLAHMMETDQE